MGHTDTRGFPGHFRTLPVMTMLPSHRGGEMPRPVKRSSPGSQPMILPAHNGNRPQNRLCAAETTGRPPRPVSLRAPDNVTTKVWTHRQHLLVYPTRYLRHSTSPCRVFPYTQDVSPVIARITDGRPLWDEVHDARAVVEGRCQITEAPAMAKDAYAAWISWPGAARQPRAPPRLTHARLTYRKGGANGKPRRGQRRWTLVPASRTARRRKSRS
jgi:hypothetical protein